MSKLYTVFVSVTRRREESTILPYEVEAENEDEAEAIAFAEIEHKNYALLRQSNLQWDFDFEDFSLNVDSIDCPDEDDEDSENPKDE